MWIIKDCLLSFSSYLCTSPSHDIITVYFHANSQAKQKSTENVSGHMLKIWLCFCKKQNKSLDKCKYILNNKHQEKKRKQNLCFPYASCDAFEVLL